MLAIILCERQEHDQQPCREECQLLHELATHHLVAPRQRWSFEDLAPLLVGELPQFELRINECGALDLWLINRSEPLVFAIIAIRVPSEQRLLILNMEPPFVEPDRHPLAGQAALGVDIEALHTHIAALIDGAFELHVAQDVAQHIRLDDLSTYPAQDLNGRAQTIRTLTVRIMRRGVEGFDELGVLGLDRIERISVLKLVIRQPQLNFNYVEFPKSPSARF